VLFRDGGFRGVVIRLTALREFHIQANGSDAGRITAAAGVPLPVLITKATQAGLAGLELLWGIPGSFGGAIATNAGASGAQLGDSLLELTLLDESARELILNKREIECGYRFMKLPQGSIVVEGTLRLPKGERRSIEEGLALARSRRRQSQPWSVPSAGCVFKNPSPDNPAGAIIDRLGFKGAAVGGAQVSEVHANFIVNRGQAAAADVLRLIEKIQQQVRLSEKINLELEIQVVGEAAQHV